MLARPADSDGDGVGAGDAAGDAAAGAGVASRGRKTSQPPTARTTSTSPAATAYGHQGRFAGAAGGTSNVTRPLRRELSSGAVLAEYTQPCSAWVPGGVPGGTVSTTR